jgi:thiosulfate reductase cytochrome b subunit
MPKEIPRRVFAVVAGCAFIAFGAAWPVAEYLTKLVAPYVVFGLSAAREPIRVTTSTRYTVEFSNGITIHGWRMLPVDGVWMIFCAIFILGLWFLLLRIAGWFIRRRDAAYADDVIHFTKFEDKGPPTPR